MVHALQHAQAALLVPLTSPPTCLKPSHQLQSPTQHNHPRYVHSPGVRPHIEFTPYLWHTLVDHAEVAVDATITFTFRDGSSRQQPIGK